MKMHKYSFLPILFIIITLSSCSDVLKNTYSKKTVEGDLERIQAIKRLSNEDYELLTDYMLKNRLIDPDLKHIDQTYLELLELAKEDKKKEDAEREKNKKIQEDESQFVSNHTDHMHRALNLVPERCEIRKDWSSKNGILYKMVFFNPGEKTIVAFHGKFAFYDAFDKELKSVDITLNDKIKSQDTLTYTAPVDFTNLGPNTLYVSKDYKDLKVVWQPMKILFEDGVLLDHLTVE
jgi:hypothetical protein